MNTCHTQQILSFTIHLIGNLEVILYRVKIETSSGFLMDICLRSETFKIIIAVLILYIR